jgi:hypothetical protein
VTISSQSDANQLRSCDTVSGSITISPSVSGTITINNVEEIQGALIAEGASGLTGLFTPDLDSVQGGITLSNLDSLTTITMGGLSQVSSSIIITRNPKLKTLGFQDLEQVDGQLELTGSFDRYVHCDGHPPSKMLINIPACRYLLLIKSKVRQQSWAAVPCHAVH